VIAVAALASLSSIDSTLARTAALERIRYGQPPHQRLAALGIIRRGARSDPDLRAVLLTLSADGNRAVRSAALRALGEVGDERALSALDAIAATSGDRASGIARESATRIRARLQQE
jgi:HEAT repeat protein